MPAKHRNIMPLANDLLTMFPCIVIYGARQVGKTTLSKTLHPTWHYFDLEDPEIYENINNDLGFFFNKYPNNIILDEVQKAPKLLHKLRGVIDDARTTKNRFILTCSSSPDLSRFVLESLAGRVASIEVGTLKTNEFINKELSPIYSILFNDDFVISDLEKLTPCTQISSLENIEQMWLYGGYPEPISQNTRFKKHWFDDYYDSYINKDIGNLFPNLDKMAFRKFLILLASLSGTILNKRDIARTLEVSESSVAKYLTIAEGTFLWRMLPSFEKNITKAIVKMPKGYMRDTGLLHYLMNTGFKKDQLYTLSITGKSFENFVVEEIIKGIEATDLTNWQASYYRTKAGAEIDLIISGSFGTVPIEIKSGTSFTLRSLANLKNFIEEHHLPYGILINQGDKIDWITEKIVQIPISYL